MSKNKPIIFLDIDGILNSKAWCQRNPFTLGWEGWKSQLDPLLVNRMNRIVMCTGATIVLSSTWRFSWTAESITKLLAECGGTFTVSDVTPPEVKGRADAIYAWLDGRDVERWLAIDDNAELTELGDQWFQVEDGLTEMHVAVAVLWVRSDLDDDDYTPTPEDMIAELLHLEELGP